MAQSSGLKSWNPALACMVCLGLGMGLMGVYTFFAEALAEEFEVSTMAITSAPLALLVMPAFLAPLVGRMADKVSIRKLLLVGVTISMGSLFALSQATSIELILLCFIGFAMGMVFYGPVTVNAFLIKHYRSRSGRALAIAAMGVSLSSAVLPLLVGVLMAAFSWRGSLFALVIGLAIFLFASILFGLQATDGGGSEEGLIDDGDSNGVADTGFLRQRAFWLIGLAVAIAFMATFVIAICYKKHFTLMGFSTFDAGVFLSAGGAAGLVGKVTVAALIGRFQSQVKYFAVLLLLSQIIGYGGLVFAESYAATILCVILGGFGGGAFIPMHPILNDTYFDAGIIGRVGGAQMPMMLPVGLVGLPLSGYVFDKTGSFDLVFAAVAALFSFAILLLLKLPKPVRFNETIHYRAG